MNIILPWHFEPESTSISSIQIPSNPYLVPHQKEGTIMDYCTTEIGDKIFIECRC